MPVCERDPWRFQFFDKVECPDDVLIPTDDPDSWVWYPEHRWVYDKLKVAQSQGIACGPHGVSPEKFPVFSKPIMNLKGMGIGSHIIETPAAFDHGYQPGHMWMELLRGDHVSTDCAVERGRIKWIRHATGVAWKDGMFKHWTIHADSNPSLEDYLAQWVARHLGDYTGMLNFETIAGRIIEAHLRFADQWCDLYGKGWVEALVRLYQHGKWKFSDDDRRDGYSVPLFASHGAAFHFPPADVQARIRGMPDISSLQITFHENKNPGDHPMPPGGFRVGIVNCTNLKSGEIARHELAKSFPAELIMLP